MGTQVRLYWKKVQILFLRDRRWIWTVFIVYLSSLLLFAVLGDRGLVQSYRLWKKKVAVQQQIETTGQEVKVLEAQLKIQQHSDRMLEKIAREQFNMSGKNEKIFIFKAAKE